MARWLLLTAAPHLGEWTSRVTNVGVGRTVGLEPAIVHPAPRGSTMRPLGRVPVPRALVSGTKSVANTWIHGLRASETDAPVHSGVA